MYRITAYIPKPYPHASSTPLNSRRPFQMPGGADVRWRTVRDGPVQQVRGRKLAPRQCCRQRENVGDAPGRDAIWGMAADKPLCLCGAAKAASISTKEEGPTRPAPRLIPSGAKRREALPLASSRRLLKPAPVEPCAVICYAALPSSSMEPS